MNYDETPERDDLTQECVDPEHPFGDTCHPSTCSEERVPEDQAKDYLAKGLDKRDAGRVQDALADFAASASVAMYEIRTTFLGLVQDEKFQSLLAACEAAATPVRTVQPPMLDDTDAADPADDDLVARHWTAGVIVGRVKALLDEAPVKEFTIIDELGDDPRRSARFSGGTYDALAVGVLSSLRNNLDMFRDRKIEDSDLDEMIELISGRGH